MPVWLDIKINKSKKKKKDINVCFSKHTFSSKKMGWLGSRPRPNPSQQFFFFLFFFCGLDLAQPYGLGLIHLTQPGYWSNPVTKLAIATGMHEFIHACLQQ
jgi:hypothetical protein